MYTLVEYRCLLYIFVHFKHIIKTTISEKFDHKKIQFYLLSGNRNDELLINIYPPYLGVRVTNKDGNKSRQEKKNSS